MAFFVAVIIYDFIDIMVLALLLFLLLDFNYIADTCRGLLLLILFFRISLFFIFFVGLFKKLAYLRSLGQDGFYFFYLRLLWVKVFGSYSLSLHLQGNAIGKVMTSKITDVRVLDYSTRS